MTDRVHGGVHEGFSGERKVDYVTLTFSVDITTSAYDIPGSVLENAIKHLETRGNVLAIGPLDATGQIVDVILAASQGWPSDSTGVLFTGVDVTGLLVDGVTELAATCEGTYAKLSGLAAAEAADLIEFPEGSTEYYTKRRFVE